jgi:hypothetical protein
MAGDLEPKVCYVGPVQYPSTGYNHILEQVSHLKVKTKFALLFLGLFISPDQHDTWALLCFSLFFFSFGGTGL